MEATSTEMEASQPLVGYRTNEEWQDLLAQVATMIEDIESLPDETVRQRILSTLQAIDAVHREALHRLVRLFKHGVLEQVVTDPAIRTLMGMYDLLPEEKSGCAKVWDFLPEAVTSLDEAGPVEGSSDLLEGLVPNELPHWLPVPNDQCPSEGEAIVSGMAKRTMILAQVERAFYGLEATCPHHQQTMDGGTLRGLSWICPHGTGCIFDIRNGARLGGGSGLICYPVRQTKEGALQIGFGMPFEPKLSAF